jgi:hypothetical protein
VIPGGELRTLNLNIDRERILRKQSEPYKVCFCQLTIVNADGPNNGDCSKPPSKGHAKGSVMKVTSTPSADG